jgi:uncharacterized protein
VSDFSAVRLRVPLTSPQATTSTSAVLWRPARDAGGPGIVLGHGAGSDLTSQVLLAVGRGLAARGYPTVAFNFAYAEAGRRRPDPPARLEQAYRDVIAAAAEAMGGRPLVLGGRSMGGRIASRLAAQGEPCAGLLLLGYPLHQRQRVEERGRPIPRERLRTAHWPEITVPSLFVQGDRDALADLGLLHRELRRQMTAGVSRTHVVAGADHSFGVRKMDGRTPAEVLAEVVEAAADWLDGLSSDLGPSILAV